MDNIDPSLLARQIDAYCAANGIPKSDFYEKTGISSATLSQWRKGVYAPSAKSIDAIEFFTSMPIDALLYGRPSIEAVFNAPNVTDDVVTFPVIADVAAGYDHIAYDDWDGSNIDIPRSFLHGHPPTDCFVLRVKGDSMYPDYQDGDHVLVSRQSTMDRSGQVGVVIYGDENATLKRIEYAMGENWMILRPINTHFPPIRIENEDLEHCKVLGVARFVIREVK